MTLIRIAVMAVLVGALAVSACGRKGFPDKPSEAKKEQTKN